MQRKSFLFYRSFYDAIRLLGDKSRLKLYDSVMKLNFECDENVSNLEQLCTEIETNLKQNRSIYAQFLLIKPQIIANLIRYKNGCKGAECGGLGGAPKGNKNACKNNPKTTPKEEGIRKKEERRRNKEEGIRNKDISFKKEKKEKSFQNFQNSDFEEIETNEINEINETNEPSLRAIAKQSKDSNTLLEEEKWEDFGKNSKIEEVCNAPPPKKNKENDPYCFYSKVRAVYADIIGEQGAYLNDTQVHDLYRLYLSTDDFIETLNDTLKELVKVQKIFKKKIGYSPGLDWIVKADGKNYSTLRNKSFTGLEEENKGNEVFQIAI